MDEDFEPVEDFEQVEDFESLEELELVEGMEPMEDDIPNIEALEGYDEGVVDMESIERESDISRTDQIDALYDLKAELETYKDVDDDDQDPDEKILSLHM